MIGAEVLTGKSQETYERAKQLIPGGTQLLSKRPEMFLPNHWPAYYEKAAGCRLWDLDGREFVDTAYMGVGANVLGFCISGDRYLIACIARASWNPVISHELIIS